MQAINTTLSGRSHEQLRFIRRHVMAQRGSHVSLKQTLAEIISQCHLNVVRRLHNHPPDPVEVVTRDLDPMATRDPYQPTIEAGREDGE